MCDNYYYYTPVRRQFNCNIYILSLFPNKLYNNYCKILKRELIRNEKKNK